jgi:hypothetical protein
MKAKFGDKLQKYKELASEIRSLTRKRVRVSPIIVSSMGAIYAPSLKALKKILQCNDRELRKVGRQMSDTVIKGSMEIWREFITNRRSEDTCEGDERRELEEEELHLEERPAGEEGQEEPTLNDEEWIGEDEDEGVELMEDIGGNEEEEEVERMRNEIEPGSDEDDGQGEEEER